MRSELLAGLTTAVLLAASVRAATPAPEPTVREGIGVNIHFTGAPARDLDLIRDAGIGWVRMDFAWSRVERVRGRYDFGPYDELVDGLAARSLRALFILDYSNRLYEKDRSVRTEEGRRAFARFAAAAASRYRGRGVRWEIWNEPNLEGFWKPQPAAKDYAALAIAAARAIREVDPEATILAPASSGFPWGFLEEIFERGVLEHVDEVSVHPYRAQPPETVAPDYARLRGLIERHRSGSESGASAAASAPVPIVSGEWGYSTWHHGGRPIAAETQGKYLARMMLTNLAHGIPLSIWYDWADDGPDPRETEHNFGTVTLDRKPKPAYEAMRTLTTVLGRTRFQRVLVAPPRGSAARVLAFAADEDPGTRRYALWSAGAPRRIRILPARDEAAATAPREPLTITEWRGETRGLPAASDGGWEVALTDAPAYLTVPSTIAEACGGIRVYDLEIEPEERGLRARVTRGVDAPPSTRSEANPADRPPAPILEMRVTREGGETIVVGHPVAGDIGSEVIVPWPEDLSAGEPVRIEATLRGRIRPDRPRPGAPGVVLVRPAPIRIAAVPAWLPEKGAESRFAHLRVALDGDAEVVADVRIEPAVSAPAPGGKQAIAALRIDYRMARGWKFARVVPPAASGAIPGRPRALSIWARRAGDETRGPAPTLRCRVRDAKGETFQPDAGAVSWTDWRRVELPLTGEATGCWGGDGRIDYPIRWDTIALVEAGREGAEGAIELHSPCLVYDARP